MIILTLAAVYFFIAGIIFGDMLDEVRVEPLFWWPKIGVFLLSIFWILLFIWGFISMYSERADQLYKKFARTIFEGDERFKRFEDAMKKRFSRSE